MQLVGACAAAGKLPPPGWTVPDENVKGVSVSDVSRFGESRFSGRTPGHGLR